MAPSVYINSVIYTCSNLWDIKRILIKADAKAVAAKGEIFSVSRLVEVNVVTVKFYLEYSITERAELTKIV